MIHTANSASMGSPSNPANAQQQQQQQAITAAAAAAAVAATFSAQGTKQDRPEPRQEKDGSNGGHHHMSSKKSSADGTVTMRKSLVRAQNTASAVDVATNVHMHVPSPKASFPVTTQQVTSIAASNTFHSGYNSNNETPEDRFDLDQFVLKAFENDFSRLINTFEQHVVSAVVGRSPCWNNKASRPIEDATPIASGEQTEHCTLPRIFTFDESDEMSSDDVSDKAKRATKEQPFEQEDGARALESALPHICAEGGESASVWRSDSSGTDHREKSVKQQVKQNQQKELSKLETKHWESATQWDRPSQQRDDDRGTKPASKTLSSPTSQASPNVQHLDNEETARSKISPLFSTPTSPRSSANKETASPRHSADDDTASPCHTVSKYPAYPSDSANKDSSQTPEQHFQPPDTPCTAARNWLEMVGDKAKDMIEQARVGLNVTRPPEAPDQKHEESNVTESNITDDKKRKMLDLSASYSAFRKVQQNSRDRADVIYARLAELHQITEEPNTKEKEDLHQSLSANERFRSSQQHEATVLKKSPASSPFAASATSPKAVSYQQDGDCTKEKSKLAPQDASKVMDGRRDKAASPPMNGNESIFRTALSGLREATKSSHSKIMEPDHENGSKVKDDQQYLDALDTGVEDNSHSSEKSRTYHAGDEAKVEIDDRAKKQGLSLSSSEVLFPAVSTRTERADIPYDQSIKEGTAEEDHSEISSLDDSDKFMSRNSDPHFATQCRSFDGVGSTARGESAEPQLHHHENQSKGSTTFEVSHDSISTRLTEEGARFRSPPVKNDNSISSTREVTYSLSFTSTTVEVGSQPATNEFENPPTPTFRELRAQVRRNFMEKQTAQAQ